MKLYDPKKKDSFVMQLGFPYPDQLKKKNTVKIYNIDEVFRTKQDI